MNFSDIEKTIKATENMIQETRERQRRHGVLLQRAENALDSIENIQERQRAADIIADLKATGSATTYNDKIADFFARCGFYVGGNTQNKYLYKIKFSIYE